MADHRSFGFSCYSGQALDQPSPTSFCLDGGMTQVVNHRHRILLRECARKAAAVKIQDARKSYCVTV
jgi:hypothetical protein